ncbi:MAG: DNA repair protein RadA [Synergistetes bacterium]|nr:DNA repair protein RadA [Synergistota bacterium]
MPKAKVRYVCQNCGYESIKWLGNCPECGAWGSFVEKTPPLTLSSSSSAVASLGEVLAKEEERLCTGIEEFDRVLGGGIVKGSVSLLGGEPGVGKSTLLLQVANALSLQGLKVLYISAEESPRQVALRAKRLGIRAKSISLLSESEVDTALELANSLEVDLIVVDSIQTVRASNVSSVPGSPSQVRECAQKIFSFAKERGVSTFIVGHVTKEGAIAGPKLLEHLVDVVLYFEGDKRMQYRTLRAVKNRYGSTLEVGIFEMTSSGLREVKDPSAIFLSGLGGVSGAAIGVVMEGERPILVEIQALVAPTFFPYPKRISQGFDFNRLQLLIAVLEKRVGIPLGKYDVYLNIVGGLRSNDPALDVPVCCAIFSSYRNTPIPPGRIFIGEVGLLGEVRPVPFVFARLREASRRGFRIAYIPKASENFRFERDMEVVRVSLIKDIIKGIREGGD